MRKPTAFHVAIIMDGNGRWATRRGLPRSAGHQAGVRAARLVTQAAPDLGVTTLSLFAFSSDNWRRPRAEVNALMSLLRHYLACELARSGAERNSADGHRPARPVAGRFEDRDPGRRAGLGKGRNGSICGSRIDYSVARRHHRYGASFVHRPGAVTRRLWPDARPRRSRYRRRSSHPFRRREAVVGFPAVGMRLRRAFASSTPCGPTSTPTIWPRPLPISGARERLLRRGAGHPGAHGGRMTMFRPSSSNSIEVCHDRAVIVSQQSQRDASRPHERSLFRFPIFS